ncbi:hypothetical protein V6N13_065496 [Hibiscus sabdariffa]
MKRKFAAERSFGRAARRRRSGGASLNQKIEAQKGVEPVRVAAGRSALLRQALPPTHAKVHVRAGWTRTHWGRPQTVVARSGGDRR